MHASHCLFLKLSMGKCQLIQTDALTYFHGLDTLGSISPSHPPQQLLRSLASNSPPLHPLSKVSSFLEMLEVTHTDNFDIFMTSLPQILLQIFIHASPCLHLSGFRETHFSPVEGHNWNDLWIPFTLILQEHYCVYHCYFSSAFPISWSYYSLWAFHDQDIDIWQLQFLCANSSNLSQKRKVLFPPDPHPPPHVWKCEPTLRKAGAQAVLCSVELDSMASWAVFSKSKLGLNNHT